jgi:thiamine pyrophosphokinase
VQAVETVVVFSGGDPPGATAVADLPTERFVIAADSGLDHATALGIAVDLVVGDLDSVAPATLAAAEAAGAVVERHPADKDQTDGELALDAAVRRGAARVIVVGGLGGRIDHLLANVAAWSAPAWSDLDVEIRAGGARISVIHGPATARWTGDVGELVTLLAVGGPATGLTTEGLGYPLRDEALEPGSTRGVSNVMVEPTASVTVGAGTLLAIRPGEGAA